MVNGECLMLDGKRNVFTRLILGPLSVQSASHLNAGILYDEYVVFRFSHSVILCSR